MDDGEGVHFERMGKLGLSEEMVPGQKLEGWEGGGSSRLREELVEKA